MALTFEKLIGSENGVQVRNKFNNNVDKLITDITYSNGQLHFELYNASIVDVNIPYPNDSIIDGFSYTSGVNLLQWVISSGTYIFDSNIYTFAGGNVTLSNGDATFDRFDVITIDSLGTLNVYEGIPSATPAIPNIMGEIAIVYLLVQAGSTGGTGTVIPSGDFMTTAPIIGDANAITFFDVSGNINGDATKMSYNTATNTVTFNNTTIDMNVTDINIIASNTIYQESIAQIFNSQQFNYWYGGFNVNIITGNGSFAMGALNDVQGDNSGAFGESNVITGNSSIVMGKTNEVNGRWSLCSGEDNISEKDWSFNYGASTKTDGLGSLAGGVGDSTTGLYVLASGIASFNHSTNTALQTAGYGATADGSAILGGQDHHIPSTFTNSVILGGQQMTADESNTVFVQNFKVNGKMRIGNTVLVSSLSDLPSPVADIITLPSDTTYVFNNTIDLGVNKLVVGANVALVGAGTSENIRLMRSYNDLDVMITSTDSISIRNLTLEAVYCQLFDLNGNPSTSAIDWHSVNITDTAFIGTIQNYANFILTDSSFLNSAELTFDGSFGTIGISGCLFNSSTGGTVFILSPTLTVTRRFRAIFSSFVITAPEIGILVDAGTTFSNDESFILNNVNFSGGGTYLSGVTEDDNVSLFTDCVGVDSSFVNGQMYMQGNATATAIGATNTFYKVLGATTPSSNNSKYLHSNNRLTCNANVQRKYLIHCNLSFTAGNNNQCEFGFYDSALGAVRTPSKTKSTASGAGVAENISFTCVVNHIAGNYIEIHASNTSAVTNITVTSMNVVITEL